MDFHAGNHTALPIVCELVPLLVNGSRAELPDIEILLAPLHFLSSMRETLYTHVLRRAAEVEGSTQALATLLKVPESTLLRWMSGHAQMPLRAFLRLVDLQIRQEKAEAAPPQVQSSSARRVSVSTGQIAARCTRCDGTDFIAPDADAGRMTTTLACANCGDSTTRGDLVVQAAKEAAHYGRTKFIALRKARKKQMLVSPKDPKQT